MLRTLFILAILVPGFYAALRSRYAALLMYLWFALFRPQDWLWIDITPARLSLVLGIVLLVPALAGGKWPNVTHPLSLGMIAFIVSSLVSQIGAVSADVGWIWIDFMVRLIVTCLLLVTLASTPRRLLGVMAVIAGALAFHASRAGIVYLLGGGTRFAHGLAGAFIDNNGYALGTVMIIPLLVATAQNAELIYVGRLTRWIRWGFYAAVPLCVFAVIGTYSRGGFLALCSATFVFVLLQRRRLTAIATVAVIISVGLLFAPIPQTYVERLQTIRTYDEIGEESAMSRPHFWRVAMRMVEVHPFGIGLRQFERAYDAYDFSHGRYGHKRAVHSSHFQVLAELGYSGAVVWTALFAYASFLTLRLRRQALTGELAPHIRQFFLTTANALTASMAGFVVGGAFMSLALNDLTWLTFGMVAALDRLSRTPEQVVMAHESTRVVVGFGRFSPVATMSPRSIGR